jgi:RimJ/RimL family protein N-acetyltransferase
MKLPSIIFRNNGFVLRKYRKKDAASIAQYANNKKIAAVLTDAFPFPYKLKDAQAYLKFQLSNYRKKNPENLAFTIEIDGEAAGSIGFRNLKPGHLAEIGYWLGEEYWGRGIMTKVVREMVRFGFKQFHLKRIYAQVYEHNQASKKVLEKNGLKEEGLLKKHAKRFGKYHNVFILGKVKN